MNQNKSRRQPTREHADRVAAFFEQNQKKLMNIAAKYGHPKELCEDIVQDAMKSVLEVDESTIKELPRYVKTAVRNRAIDQVRAVVRRSPKDQLMRDSVECDGDRDPPYSACLDAQIAPIIENVASKRREWRREIESVISKAHGAATATQATKRSLLTINKKLKRSAVEVLDFLKKHKRDVK